MGSFLRGFLVFCAVLTGVLLAFPSLRETVAATAQPAIDLFDNRPVKTVLILGNSRVYYNNMPYMLREIADSACSPVRYAIASRTIGGARFEELWNDATAQSLLKRHWDLVILQGESGGQTSDAASAGFARYGEKLAAAAAATNSPVALIVNWAYAESLYADLAPGARSRHISAIEASHRGLAASANASLIETVQVWEEAHAADRSLALTLADGNHPTRAGTYLSALMVYGFLADDRIAKVTFSPSGVDEKAAREIRDLVARHYGFGPG